MLPPFGDNWSTLALGDVETFLRDADEEGVTWEAKADDERGRLHPGSLQKAGCGFANRVGGFILIGAKWSRQASRWDLPGITPPDDEPELWIGKTLRGLMPTPRFVPKVWRLNDDRVVAVVWVDPVDEPPCMTPQGQIYERVSGETLPVKDPARLDALYRAGLHARGRAENAALSAASRALDAPRWFWERAVGVSVALAPVGRETDDIGSRLFLRSFRDAVVQSMWRFFQSGPLRQHISPTNVEAWQQQDAFTAFAHLEAQRVLLSDQGVGRHPRTTWLVQATWDGAVAASATFNPDGLEHISAIEEVVRPAWSELAPLASGLGGYGPAHLVVGIYAAPDRPREMPIEYRGQVGAPPPPPPAGTLFRHLPEHTWIRRQVTVAAPDEDTLGSIHREMERASGIESHEPTP